MTDIRKAPLSERAIKDEAKDVALADELREAAKVEELYALTRRLIQERRQVAEAFNAMVTTWNLMNSESGIRQPDQEAINSIERVAHEAISFAREVVQALTRGKPEA